MATVHCIVMTKEQADAVKWESEDGSAAVVPIALTDGSYILTPDALESALPADKMDLLKTYPLADVDRGLWPTIDPTKL